MSSDNPQEWRKRFELPESPEPLGSPSATSPRKLTGEELRRMGAEYRAQQTGEDIAREEASMSFVLGSHLLNSLQAKFGLSNADVYRLEFGTSDQKAINRIKKPFGETGNSWNEFLHEYTDRVIDITASADIRLLIFPMIVSHYLSLKLICMPRWLVSSPKRLAKAEIRWQMLAYAI